MPCGAPCQAQLHVTARALTAYPSNEGPLLPPARDSPAAASRHAGWHEHIPAAPPAGPGGPKPSLETFAQCLARHGYTEWTSYQPAGRFWVFQWIEGGWLLALALLLISVTAWLVQHRAA